jgi:hypothetical protein
LNLHEIPELEQRNVDTVTFTDARVITRDVTQKFYLFNEIGTASPVQWPGSADAAKNFDPNKKYQHFIGQTRNVTMSLLVVTCFLQTEHGDMEGLKDVYYFRFKTYKFHDLPNVYDLTDFKTVVERNQFVNVLQGYHHYTKGSESSQKPHNISIQIPIKPEVKKELLI